MNAVYVTKHAKKRIAERCGVPHSSAQRVAQRAYDNGLSMKSVKSGPVGNWLCNVYSKNENADNIRLYGDKCFVFDSNELITVLQIPTGLQKAVNSKYKKAMVA